MTDKIGCFGSVLYHDAERPRCTACPLLDQCAEETAINKVKLQKWYEELKENARTRKRACNMQVVAGPAPRNAPVVMERTARSVCATAPLIATGKVLNKKPQELADKLMAKGFDFAVALRGENPFVGYKNKTVNGGMDYILEHQSVTHRQMTDAFVAKYNWGLGTASSQASIIFDTLEYLGIVTRSGDTVTLRQE